MHSVFLGSFFLVERVHTYALIQGKKREREENNKILIPIDLDT